MVANIFGVITDVITNFVNSLNSAVGGVMNLFYYDNQLTLLGTLLLIAVGVAIVYWCFRLIMRLVRRA